MEFSDLIQKRRACHNFLPHQKIPQKDLLRIIKETSFSPSGYNAQPWEFIIAQNPSNLRHIQQIAYAQPHLTNASAIIFVIADTNIGRNTEQILADWLQLGYCTPKELPAYRNSLSKNRQPQKLREMALRNSMLAAMTLIYSAENLGYATCPMMGFRQQEMEQHLRLPPDRLIALMIAIGKANPHQQKPRLPRKSAQQLLHLEHFGNSNPITSQSESA